MSENGGERELVLGNRQLLGIFFVATLLCGVFFAMGYVVGGNSAKSGAAAADSAPATTSEGKREEPQPPPATDIAAAPAAATGDTGAQLPTVGPGIADNPAAAGAQPSPSAVPAPTQAAPVAPAPGPAAQSAGAAKSPAAAADSAATGVFVSVPEKGASYLQVAAVGRPAADDLVKTLRRKELPSILAESPKPDLFRVYVGPYRSTLSLAEAKSKLRSLGFENLVVQKY